MKYVTDDGKIISEADLRAIAVKEGIKDSDEAFSAWRYLNASYDGCKYTPKYIPVPENKQEYTETDLPKDAMAYCRIAVIKQSVSAMTDDFFDGDQETSDDVEERAEFKITFTDRHGCRNSVRLHWCAAVVNELDSMLDQFLRYSPEEIF